MLYLFVGIVIGFVLACAGFKGMCVGALKYVQDEDDTYFYMKVTTYPEEILRRNYVLLKVDHSQK